MFKLQLQFSSCSRTGRVQCGGFRSGEVRRTTDTMQTATITDRREQRNVEIHANHHDHDDEELAGVQHEHDCEAEAFS